MPLRLNVGVSKKLGLPEYSSVGASCNLEVELDSGLLHDLDGFHLRVRDVFVAAQQAVNDELARIQAQPDPSIAAPAAPADGHGHRDGAGARSNGSTSRTNGVSPRTNGARNRSSKPATPSQVKAIYAIARAQHADLEGLLRDEYGFDRPEDLSLSQASAFIDQLKAASGS
jgi:hypothetical protein